MFPVVGIDDDFNLYAYVYNDPLNRSDPTGTVGEFIAFELVLATAGADAVTPDPSDAVAPVKAAGYVGAAIGTAIGGAIVYGYNKATEQADQPDVDNSMEAREHTKNARPSTKGKHEKGTTRKNRDAGNEKGDKRRQPWNTAPSRRAEKREAERKQKQEERKKQEEQKGREERKKNT